MSFDSLGLKPELLRAVAPQARREHPLVLGVPNREIRTIHYTLPRGLELRHMPEARSATRRVFPSWRPRTPTPSRSLGGTEP